MFFNEDLTEERFSTDLGVDILYPYSPTAHKKTLTPDQVFEVAPTWHPLATRQFTN